MGIQPTLHSKIRTFARWFCTLVVAGALGATFPDVDHPLAWTFNISDGRFLHPFFFVSGCVGAVFFLGRIISHYRRLFRTGFLETERNVEIQSGENQVIMERRATRIAGGLPGKAHTLRQTFTFLLRKVGLDSLIIKDLGR